MLYLPNFIGRPLLIILFLIAIGMFAFLIWFLFLKKLFIIRFKAIPFYNKLEKEYNAKYPTIMADIYGLRYFNIDARDELETFFFVSDSSFHIVSSTRPDLYVKIPFETVLYHDCHININSKYDYNYHINLGLLIDNNKTLEIAFDTLDYNHRLDKIYGTCQNDEDLYNFIKENFIDEETYYNPPCTSH